MQFHKKRILIACGGTGGHLAPGIALAQTLIHRGHRCELLISQKLVDQRLIQKYPGLIFHPMPAVSLGKTHSNISPTALLAFFLSQVASINFCSKIFKNFKPQVVVGFGGFSTISAALCAATSRTPLILHEANHKVGRSIRALARMANVIYLPPGIAEHTLPVKKVRYLGIPLRQDLENISKTDARTALGFSPSRPLVVVMGGSQGSGPLNHWASEHLPLFEQNHIDLLCVTGLGKAPSHEKITSHNRAVFTPFSDQMHLLYAAADLVIARAGAGTINELIHFRTPSILVPYPLSSDHHQHANARHLEHMGGTQMLDENDLSQLMETTVSLLKNKDALEKMQNALAEITLGNPALTMAETIESWHGRRAHTLEEKFHATLSRKKINPETIKLAFHEPLGPKTTFGIGGPARVWAEPTNERELKTLVRLAHKLHLPVFCLGRGSNLLVLDSGYPGLVLRLSHPHWQRIETLKNGRIKAWAGARLKVICAHAAKAGLQGFEFMEGIPATLGGALHMNAGAFNAWTFERVERVGYLNPAGRLRQKSGQRLKPAYRHVPGLKNAIALWAVLKPVQKSSPEQIKQIMDGFQAHRKTTQPREASAGCVFKNPLPTLGAGQAIDQSGLKGLHVGGAQVSPIHANFIVNTGGATSADVISLMNQIRQKVWAHKKIVIEPEIMLLGGEWNHYLSVPRDE